ncbi:hypothetical protein EPO17_01775 [Patescibacteria group bacterium]|nr:MAG: hypothetical protein EPO17_01775 [Patescibacteria group bacterium]
MKIEPTVDWPRRHAWSKIRFGLTALLAFGANFALGINGFVSGGNFIIATTQLIFSALSLWVFWTQFDEAWPWISQKIDEMIY